MARVLIIDRTIQGSLDLRDGPDFEKIHGRIAKWHSAIALKNRAVGLMIRGIQFAQLPALRLSAAALTPKRSANMTFFVGCAQQ